jgi:ketosteroid isomerase-like protein
VSEEAMSERTATLPVDPRHEDRQALREALAAVTEAINQKQWSALDRWISPDAVITMIDQSTLHGRADLQQYVEAKLGRFSSVLTDLKVDPIPDAPAVFYGDTAIATMTSADRFVFRNGKEFLVQNRYTAVLVKTDGSWQLAALHGGANAFNNPISYQSQNLLLGGAALAGVGGLLLGYLAGKKE